MKDNFKIPAWIFGNGFDPSPLMNYYYTKSTFRLTDDNVFHLLDYVKIRFFGAPDEKNASSNEKIGQAVYDAFRCSDRFELVLPRLLRNQKSVDYYLTNLRYFKIIFGANHNSIGHFDITGEFEPTRNAKIADIRRDFASTFLDIVEKSNKKVGLKSVHLERSDTFARAMSNESFSMATHCLSFGNASCAKRVLPNKNITFAVLVTGFVPQFKFRVAPTLQCLVLDDKVNSAVVPCGRKSPSVKYDPTFVRDITPTCLIISRDFESRNSDVYDLNFWNVSRLTSLDVGNRSFKPNATSRTFLTKIVCDSEIFNMNSVGIVTPKHMILYDAPATNNVITEKFKTYAMTVDTLGSDSLNLMFKLLRKSGSNDDDTIVTTFDNLTLDWSRQHGSIPKIDGCEFAGIIDKFVKMIKNNARSIKSLSLRLSRDGRFYENVVADFSRAATKRPVYNLESIDDFEFKGSARSALMMLRAMESSWEMFGKTSNNGLQRLKLSVLDDNDDSDREKLWTFLQESDYVLRLKEFLIFDAKSSDSVGISRALSRFGKLSKLVLISRSDETVENCCFLDSPKRAGSFNEVARVVATESKITVIESNVKSLRRLSLTDYILNRLEKFESLDATEMRYVLTYLEGTRLPLFETFVTLKNRIRNGEKSYPLDSPVACKRFKA